MPQVPYQPFSTAEPTSGGENVSVNAPAAAFGGNVGQALESLGTTGQQVGNEIFSRAMALQDLHNESVARDAQNTYATTVGQKQAEFDSLKGDAQAKALPDHIKWLSDFRKELSDNLNPMARRHYDSDSMPFMQRNIILSSSRAADSFKSYVGDEAIASTKNLLTTWVDPNNTKELQDKHDKGVSLIESAVPAKGWGPSEVAAQTKAFESQLYGTQLNELSRIGQTQKAYDLFNQYKDSGLLDVKDVDQVQNNIWKWNEAIAAKNAVKNIYSNDKSDTKMYDEVDKLADDPKMNLGDPNFGSSLRAALGHEMVYQKRQITDERNTNETVLYRAVNAGQVSSQSDILNNPDTAAAYNALPDKDKNKWDKLVYTAAGKRDQQTETQSYNSLTALADQNPQEFLRQNLYDNKWKLNKEDTNHFIGLRDRLIKQPIDDPQVRQAINVLTTEYAPQMKALGLLKQDSGLPNKGDDWNSFTGGLSVALREFRDVNKRPPSAEEFRDKIVNPLFKTHAEPGRLWGTNDVPEFLRTFSPTEINSAKRAMSAGGLTPSDNEVHNFLLQKQWKDFYQGSSNADQPTAPNSK